MFAAYVRAGEQQIVAQEVAQQQSRFNTALVLRTVDRNCNLVSVSGHGAPARLPLPGRAW
jgi:hypothetical protein